MDMREKGAGTIGSKICMIITLIIIISGMSTGVLATENIDLGNLDKTFTGEKGSGYTGFSISDAGDVNGDGYDDILIGSHENSETLTRAGKTYLVFGNKSRDAHHLDLSNASASFKGENARDRSGYSVSGVGDINGDGYDDFMIGAPYWGYQWNDEVGKVYLFYGRENGWSRDVSLSTANATFIGHWEEEKAGWSLSGAGDVNGDGYDDILIGAPYHNNRHGKIYIILGSSNKITSKNIILSGADASYEGESSSDGAGISISGAGDVNGDGYDDFVIGAPIADGPYGYPTDRTKGKVYLIYGMGSGWKRDVDLSNANASFWGEANTGRAGEAVSGAGDVDADGYDDFIVGVPMQQGGGRFYLFLGGNTSWKTDGYMYHSDVVFTGHTDQGDNIGISLSGVGDLDGDGYDDFIAGASGDDDGGTDAGKCYIILGRGKWPTGVDIYKSNRTLTGERAGDNAGNCVSGAGDFNNDGNPDILVAAYKNDDGGSDDGKVYLHFYKLPLPSLNTVDLEFATEDEPYLSVYNGSDAEDDYSELDWRMKTDADWLTFDMENLTLKGTPQNEDVGESWVNISVGNSYGGRDFSNFTLTVNNTNDPPWIDTIGNHTAIEDEEYLVAFNATDIDPVGDILNWSLRTNTDWLYMNSSSGNLTGTPLNKDVGMFWVNITVDDGNGGSDDQNYTIEVFNVNDDPDLTTEDVTSVMEDAIYFVDYEAVDIDPTNDVLNWSLVTDADFLDMDRSTGKLSGIPDDSDIGSWSVNVIVDDGRGGLDSTEFDLMVHNINDAPTIVTEPVTSVNEDEQYYCKMRFRDDDPEGGEYTWHLVENDFLSINGTTGEMTGTPNNTHVGEHNITVRVRDDKGGSDELTFVLEVVNTNDAPVIFEEQGWNSTLKEDAPIDIPIEFEDVDPDGSGDEMSWYLVEPTDASFISIDRDTGRLQGTPTNDDLGTWTINVSVNDGQGGVDWGLFLIEVINVNDDPAILTGSVPDMTEDVYFTHFLKAEDIDPTDDIITWSVLGSSIGSMKAEPYTGKLFCTPDNNETGAGWVMMKASDDKGGSSTRNYSFSVHGVNDDPQVIGAPEDLSCKEDSEIVLDLLKVFGDVDGDELSFNCEGPSDVEIEIDNGTLKLIPGPDVNGEHTLRITASDGTSSITIYLDLDIEPVNDPPRDPRITGNSSFVEGEIIRLSASALDPDVLDDDSLTYSWWSRPADINESGIEIEFTLEPGEYEIYLRVTDSSGNSTTTSMTIVVEEDRSDGANGSILWILFILLLIIIAVAAFTALLVYLRGRYPVDESEDEWDEEETMDW